jgi:hypothetical protein
VTVAGNADNNGNKPATRNKPAASENAAKAPAQTTQESSTVAKPPATEKPAVAQNTSGEQRSPQKTDNERLLPWEKPAAADSQKTYKVWSSGDTED